MGKNAESYAEKVRTRKAVLDIVTRMMDILDSEEKDALYDLRVVGKEPEQATDWKTGELRWEDEEHTIPYHKDKWDYVLIPEDERSEEQKAKLRAIDIIAEALSKLG